MSSLFTSTEVLNLGRSGDRGANSSSRPAPTASPCSSAARVPHPGQRSTGSVWTSETSSEKDSSHFWHWKSSCMVPPVRVPTDAQHSHARVHVKRSVPKKFIRSGSQPFNASRLTLISLYSPLARRYLPRPL